MNTTTQIVAILATAAVLSTPAACTIHKQRIVAKAIAGGADPIEARCAIEGDSSYSNVCVLAAARARSEKAPK